MQETRHKAPAACLRFEGELQAYLEGESRPFIVSHSQECLSCGALLTDLQAISRAARDLPSAEPSPLVWTKVRARLEAEGAFAVPACLRFNDELAAYLEGETRPFIPVHARDCPACGALLTDLQAIREAAQTLPQQAPSDRVWRRLRSTLVQEGAFGQPVGGWRQILSWRLVPHLVPAGVLAGLVFLASVMTLPWSSLSRWGGGGEAGGPAAVVQLGTAVPVSEDTALADVVSDLERSFKANEASMAPDLKASYEKSLVSLDDSIQECLDSLRSEPRNTLAHEYLVTAYTRKAEVLSSALEFDGR